jgi:ketosteroid isomerase-like protein
LSGGTQEIAMNAPENKTIENKTIMQRIFAELATGNSAPLLESFADDFRFVVMGSSRWSRTLRRQGGGARRIVRAAAGAD